MTIGQYMRGAWAAFAKDPVNGLSDYGGGWPRYSTGGQTLIRLAFNNMTGTNLAAGNQYDSGCPAAAAAVSPKNSSSATSGASASTSAPLRLVVPLAAFLVIFVI